MVFLGFVPLGGNDIFPRAILYSYLTLNTDMHVTVRTNGFTILPLLNDTIAWRKAT